MLRNLTLEDTIENHQILRQSSVLVVYWRCVEFQEFRWVGGCVVMLFKRSIGRPGVVFWGLFSGEVRYTIVSLRSARRVWQEGFSDARRGKKTLMDWEQKLGRRRI
jgi:hypothetical protein